MRLVQLAHPARGRATAVVNDGTLALIRDYGSCYDLVQAALTKDTPIGNLVGGTESIAYDDVYNGASDWRLLPAFDHPSEPALCLVSGTGLTHISSAATRQAMHGDEQSETDSMRMYRWGVEGGRPAAGCIGVAPEWFYKGDGSILRAHNEPLLVPWFAEDGGDEAEIAGVYVIDPNGGVVRVGMAAGNEFSDHKFERRNYLYLAHSKLRECAIGPELIIGPKFDFVPGEARIGRDGEILWSKAIASGGQRMCHSLENIEHHHFKYDRHRRPGDVHIHFFGADSFSFGAGIELRAGDVMEVRFEGFGRPLRNVVRREERGGERIRVREL